MKLKRLTKNEKEWVTRYFSSPNLIQEKGAFIGYIGEEYILRRLRNEGFLVARTQNIEENTFNSEELKWLLGLYSKGGKLFNFLEKIPFGLPDFICLKDNEVSFVEVKSNRAELRERQKEVIELLKSKGYKVDIRRPEVYLFLKENDEEFNNTPVHFVSKDKLKKS